MTSSSFRGSMSSLSPSGMCTGRGLLFNCFLSSFLNIILYTCTALVQCSGAGPVPVHAACFSSAQFPDKKIYILYINKEKKYSSEK